jgi:hypothetical protein
MLMHLRKATAHDITRETELETVSTFPEFAPVRIRPFEKQIDSV